MYVEMYVFLKLFNLVLDFKELTSGEFKLKHKTWSHPGVQLFVL